MRAPNLGRTFAGLASVLLFAASAGAGEAPGSAPGVTVPASAKAGGGRVSAAVETRDPIVLGRGQRPVLLRSASVIRAGGPPSFSITTLRDARAVDRRRVGGIPAGPARGRLLHGDDLIVRPLDEPFAAFNEGNRRAQLRFYDATTTDLSRYRDAERSAQLSFHRSTLSPEGRLRLDRELARDRALDLDRARAMERREIRAQRAVGGTGGRLRIRPDGVPLDPYRVAR